MAARHEVTGKKMPSRQLLRLLYFKRDLCELFKVTPVTIWSWQRRAGFPRAIEVCGKSAWFVEEVHAWIAKRPRRRLKGDAAITDQDN
jgi:predicted DNA-binding transcriptional regulator AlpA